MPGPVPKRSEDRVRRNKPEIPIDNVAMTGEVPVPELGFDVHPIVLDLYRSLGDSGQSRYYEPSDWQVARVLCYVLDDFISRGKLSAQMLMAINSMFGDLMLTEGSRRRLRMEIERNAAEEKQDDGTAEIIQMYKDLLK